MGELSKLIGQDGEDLVTDFFTKIGWTPLTVSKDIPCVNGESHKKGEGPRKEHGLDIIFSYVCPIANSVRKNVLISVKNSFQEKAPSRTKTKIDIEDVSQALECFKRSPLKSELQSRGGGATTSQDFGLIFILNKEFDATRSFVSGTKQKEEVSTLSRNSVSVIENWRFDFIDAVINHIKLRCENWRWSFHYPESTTSATGEERQPNGRILPLESLIDGPLAIHLETTIHERNVTRLLLFSAECYTVENFKRLAGLGLGLSSNFAEVTLVFPDSTSSTLDSDLGTLLAPMRSREYASKIKSESYATKSRLR